MSSKNELLALSKRELIRRFLALEKINIEFAERLKKVEAILRQYENPNTPSSKKRFKGDTKKDEKDPNKKRFPGRPKDHEGAGIKLPKPDKIEEHKIEKEGYVKIGKFTKTVIDFVDMPLLVTKHIIYKYRAPDGSIVWPEIDLPKGAYGKNLQAFVTLLKGRLGVSHESIADIIKGFRNDVTFCPATSLNMTNIMADALEPERQNIISAIRKAMYNNADETGLRQDGKDGYAWVFCNPTHALYEVDLSRSKDVPERVLGPDYDNWLVVDGWSAYAKYKKQRCWPHLMRELDELAENSKEIEEQSLYLHNLYEQCLETKNKPPDERILFAEKMNSKTQIGYMIESLSKIKECNEFVTKIENARPYLFTGVIHPEIPLDNNHAERMLRLLVVHRKLMGCIRNDKGKKFIENVVSSIQTWKLQEKNIYQALRSFAS